MKKFFCVLISIVSMSNAFGQYKKFSKSDFLIGLEKVTSNGEFTGINELLNAHLGFYITDNLGKAKEEIFEMNKSKENFILTLEYVISEKGYEEKSLKIEELSGSQNENIITEIEMLLQELSFEKIFNLTSGFEKVSMQTKLEYIIPKINIEEKIVFIPSNKDHISSDRMTFKGSVEKCCDDESLKKFSECFFVAIQKYIKKHDLKLFSTLDSLGIYGLMKIYVKFRLNDQQDVSVEEINSKHPRLNKPLKELISKFNTTNIVPPNYYGYNYNILYSTPIIISRY